MFQTYISTRHSTKIVLIKWLLNKVFHSFTTTRILSQRFVEKAWTTDSKIRKKSLSCLEKRNCAKQFLQAVHNGFEQKIIAVFSRFPQSFPQPCRICRIPQFPHKNRLLKPKKRPERIPYGLSTIRPHKISSPTDIFSDATLPKKSIPV